MLKRCIIAENRKLHASPIWVIFFAVVQPVDAAHAVLLDAVLSRDGVGVCGLPLAA